MEIVAHQPKIGYVSVVGEAAELLDPELSRNHNDLPIYSLLPVCRHKNPDHPIAGGP